MKKNIIRLCLIMIMLDIIASIFYYKKKNAEYAELVAKITAEDNSSISPIEATTTSAEVKTESSTVSQEAITEESSSVSSLYEPLTVTGISDEAKDVSGDYDTMTFDQMSSDYFDSGKQYIVGEDDKPLEEDMTVGVLGYVIADNFAKCGVDDVYKFDEMKNLVFQNQDNVCTWKLNSDKTSITISVDFTNEKIQVDDFSY